MRYMFILFLFLVFSCKSVPTDQVEKPKSEVQLDSDGDGISDNYDKCPDIKGTENNMGCPDVELQSDRIAKSNPPKDDNISNQLVNKKIEKKILRKTKKNESSIINSIDEVDIKNKGLIAYSVPSQMEVGKEYQVKVRISKSNNKTFLLVGDREIPISDNLDDVKIESITISPIMSASLLSSKKYFDITSLSTDIQNIEENGYTEWSWNIIPLQDGENNLKLNVKIRIKEDGNNYFKDITIFERKIKVKSNIGNNIKDFIFNNWEWFMSIIFIPLIQWFWVFWKRKKGKNKEDVN
jgi:hypothetical protein